MNQKSQGRNVTEAFYSWTNNRAVPSLGTNAGAEKLPFQGWRNFKEAFAPELVAQAVSESKRTVHSCIDPFGGSGTTALACQFLGVHPVTMEVNPYLADLIEAKLTHYDISELTQDFGQIIRSAKRQRAAHDTSFLPSTFIEPGVNGKWLFPKPAAQRALSYHNAIAKLESERNQRFFKVLLGGILVEVSNTIVSGKGRRYRKSWESRQRTAADVDELFQRRVQSALNEVARYAYRPAKEFSLIRGDCRENLSSCAKVDLAIFSPPYPNSFDYTDVYNIELWMLEYLRDSMQNKVLRRSTLSSHVQVKRDFSARPVESSTLNNVSMKLHKNVSSLWNSSIPKMVDGYFADMLTILSILQRKLYKNGEAWLVVGDSQYADIHIPVAKILDELAGSIGYETVRSTAFRSMRSSAQQGWKENLSETLLVLRKT